MQTVGVYYPDHVGVNYFPKFVWFRFPAPYLEVRTCFADSSHPPSRLYLTAFQPSSPLAENKPLIPPLLTPLATRLAAFHLSETVSFQFTSCLFVPQNFVSSRSLTPSTAFVPSFPLFPSTFVVRPSCYDGGDSLSSSGAGGNSTKSCRRGMMVI